MKRMFYRSHLLLSLMLIMGCHGAVFLSVTNNNGNQHFNIKTYRVDNIQNILMWSNENTEWIWKVVAPSANNIRDIDYGFVPEGMHQIFPESGIKPRPLKKGEIVAVHISFTYVDVNNILLFPVLMGKNREYIFQVQDNGELQEIKDIVINYPQKFPFEIRNIGGYSIVR